MINEHTPPFDLVLSVFLGSPERADDIPALTQGGTLHLHKNPRKKKKIFMIFVEVKSY